MKKRILTLALALAAVCALAVTAMADANPQAPTTSFADPTNGRSLCSTCTPGSPADTTPATCHSAGTRTWTCTTCGATATAVIDATGVHNFTGAWQTDNPAGHYHKCQNDGCTATDTPEAHTPGGWVTSDSAKHWKECSVCHAKSDEANHSLTYADINSSTHTGNCSCGYTTGPVAHTPGTTWASDATNHWKTCTACGNKEQEAAHDTAVAEKDTTHHWTKCPTCDYVLTSKVAHTFTSFVSGTDAAGHTYKCSGCAETKVTAHTHTYTIDSVNGQHTASECTDTKCTYTPSPATVAHSFNATTGLCVCGAMNNATPTAGTLTAAFTTMGVGESKALTYTLKNGATPTNNRTGISFVSLTPAIASVNYNTTSGAVAVYGLSTGTATIAMQLTSGSPATTTTLATVTFTVKNTHNVSVTIAQNIGTYSFADTSTTTGQSVANLIYAAIPGISTVNYSTYTFTITPTSAYTVGTLNNYYTGIVGGNTLANLGQVYLTVTSTGTWTGTYVIKNNLGTEVLSGTITIVIEPYTGIDILYTATLGQNVAINPADFQTFWREHTNSYGSLTSVRINSVSGLNGTLCYDHKTTETHHTNASGTTFYVSPTTATQKSINGLTFVPTKLGNQYNSGTVTINFTATGTNRYNSVASTTATGSIVIAYTNGEVQSINYNSASSYINLRSVDFTAIYKTATKTNIQNPTFTIKFLEVPTYGVLYRYTGTTNGFTTTNAVKLTKENIDSTYFYNSSNSTSSIDKVVYMPSYASGVTDTIRYAVYTGSTLAYVGTITFNAEELIINYSSTSTGVTFDGYDFFYNNASLYNAQYISFGAPSSGALYKNYANGKGSVVTSSDYFSYTGATALSTVTYVPKANFTGVVEIPFYAHSLSNTYVTGTVKVYVVAKPFADVPNDWSAPYINRLYASGVVGGTSATTFSPKANVKYGEALKMIMLAAGYPKQSESGGKHWASNYLSLAYTNRIVSTTNIDLNAYADRNTIAEIAAKALGLSAATYVNAGVIGPVDSTNGYVYALYNAGIVGGEVYNGTSYFYGSRNITRAEVAKIICNVMDYDK